MIVIGLLVVGLLVFAFVRASAERRARLKAENKLQNERDELERKYQEAVDWSDYYYHRCLALEGELKCKSCGAAMKRVAEYRSHWHEHVQSDMLKYKDGQLQGGPEAAVNLLIDAAGPPTWFRIIDGAPPEKSSD